VREVKYSADGKWMLSKIKETNIKTRGKTSGTCNN